MLYENDTMMTNEQYHKIFNEMNTALYSKKDKDKISLTEAENIFLKENTKIVEDDFLRKTQKELLKEQYNVFKKAENSNKESDTFKKIVSSMDFSPIDTLEDNSALEKLAELKYFSDYETENDVLENYDIENINLENDDAIDAAASNSNSSSKTVQPNKRADRREGKKLRRLNVQRDIYNSIKNNQNTLFKKIGSYIFDRVEIMKLSSNEKDQYRMVSSFIEHGMLDKVVTMQAQGYKLPNRLQGQFDEAMFDLIQSKPLPLFEKILNDFGTIPKEYLLAATFSQVGKSIYFPSLIKNREENYRGHYNNQAQMIIHKYPYINLYMKEIVKDKEFLNDLITFAIDVITNTTKIVVSKNFSRQEVAKQQRIFNILIQENKFIFEIPDIWQTISLPQYLDTIKSFKEAQLSIQKKLKSYDSDLEHRIFVPFKEVNNTLNNIIEGMTNNLDKLYSSILEQGSNNTNSLRKVINENTKGNTKINETYADLPKEAQELIKKLYNNYTIIKNEDKNFLESIDFNEVEIIITKRLPDVVKKYRAVNNDYKNNMLNIEGKNSTQLVIESLKFLDKSIVNYMEGINEAKVSVLSASKRHSEEIFQQSIKSGRSNIHKNQVTANAQQLEVEFETDIEQSVTNIKVVTGNRKM